MIPLDFRLFVGNQFWLALGIGPRLEAFSRLFVSVTTKEPTGVWGGSRPNERKIAMTNGRRGDLPLWSAYSRGCFSTWIVYEVQTQYLKHGAPGELNGVGAWAAGYLGGSSSFSDLRAQRADPLLQTLTFKDEAHEEVSAWFGRGHRGCRRRPVRRSSCKQVGAHRIRQGLQRRRHGWLY